MIISGQSIKAAGIQKEAAAFYLICHGFNSPQLAVGKLILSGSETLQFCYRKFHWLTFMSGHTPGQMNCPGASPVNAV